jgi:anti-anti-sigma factor
VNLRLRHESTTLVFELDGNLDFETTIQFGETYISLIQKHNPERIIVNLQGLRFVGSSGINQFIKILRDFNTKNCKPRFCHLSPEFVRLFRAYQTSRKPFEIYLTEDEAKSSCHEPISPFGHRRRRRAHRA